MNEKYSGNNSLYFGTGTIFVDLGEASRLSVIFCEPSPTCSVVFQVSNLIHGERRNDTNNQGYPALPLSSLRSACLSGLKIFAVIELEF